MKLCLFVIGLTWFGSARAAIPGFDARAVRSALRNGERLAELIQHYERIPRPERLGALIDAIEFKFPRDTSITHFADRHWSPRASFESVIGSFESQREFLMVLTPDAETAVFWEGVSFDHLPEHLPKLLAHHREHTTPGLFAKITDDPRMASECEKLFLLGAAGYLLNEGTIDAIHSAGSHPLQDWAVANQQEENDTFIFDLREIVAVLRIEEFLNHAPLTKPKATLIFGGAHFFEGRFSEIPNLSWSTHISTSVRPLYIEAIEIAKRRKIEREGDDFARE